MNQPYDGGGPGPYQPPHQNPPPQSPYPPAQPYPQQQPQPPYPQQPHGQQPYSQQPGPQQPYPQQPQPHPYPPQNAAPQYNSPQYNSPQYNSPQYGPPQYGPPGTPPPYGYGPPSLPPKKSSTGKVIVVIVAVLFLLVAGAGGVRELVKGSSPSSPPTVAAPSSETQWSPTITTTTPASKPFTVGMCLTAFDNDASGSITFRETDCAIRSALYRIATMGAPGASLTCRTDNYDKATLEDGTPMCLAYNLTQGFCYKTKSGSQGSALAETACVPTPGYDTVRVDSRAPTIASGDCVPPRTVVEFVDPIPVSYCLSVVT